MTELPKISELLKQPEKMRVMCGEACGWTYPGSTCLKYESWGNWNPPLGWKGKRGASLPKYDTSLDAMAKAEATLTDEEHANFRAAIAMSIAREFPPSVTSDAYFRAYYNRTALQRLAAFLIAKGLAQP
jgi:hypothetical protein